MAATVHPAQDPQAQSSTSSQAGGQVRLRRAVYVHVSDLTSAYDIDHAKLEQELSRVRAQRDVTAAAAAAAAASSSQEPTAADAVAAAAAAATAPGIDATASYPQKRLQPPRGGYNLCV